MLLHAVLEPRLGHDPAVCMFRCLQRVPIAGRRIRDRRGTVASSVAPQETTATQTSTSRPGVAYGRKRYFKPSPKI